MTILVPPGRISNVISIGRGLFSGAVGLALGPWGKLIGIAILVVGGFWWFRIWLNRHDDRIFEDGKQRAIAVLEEKYVATWQQKLTDAKNMTDTANAKLQIAEQMTKQIDANFAVVLNRLDGISVDVKKRDVIYVEKTDSLSASELVPAIRVLSDAIARQFPVR